MNKDSISLIVPSCPPVSEDSHKVSSPADPNLPLPCNDEEMIKVLDNFKFDETNFYYPFLTPKLLAVTGKDEWNQGRWFQPGHSVYGVAVYILLKTNTFNLGTVHYTYQQPIAIGMVQGYILF